MQDPSAVPGLSDDTDGSQENFLPQPSKPLSASTAGAHELFGPSATSPAPHQSMMNQQHLSAMTPKPAPCEPPPQPLLGSCSTGVRDRVPPAQSGYPRQHAVEGSEAPPSVYMHSVLQCTSPVKHALPSQASDAAPHSSLSSGSALASPTAKRRRAAKKSVQMMDNTPLAAAAADVARSAAIMQNIPMMTVPDGSKDKSSDRTKLSPPKGLSVSPIKSATPGNVHWPAAAHMLRQHAEPPMTSPGKPAVHNEDFRVPAALGSSRHAAPATNTGGDARSVEDVPNPFQHSSHFREYARASGLGCADSEINAELLIQQASGHEMSQGLTDDQFQPSMSQTCSKVTDLFATSTQSMQAAELSGAHYIDQLKQHSLLSCPVSQSPDQNAIDLCDDDAMLDPVTLSDNRERQAQISSDERLAQELEMDNRPGMQDVNVSLHVVATMLLSFAIANCQLELGTLHSNLWCLSFCARYPCCAWPSTWKSWLLAFSELPAKPKYINHKP